jgi:integrase
MIMLYLRLDQAQELLRACEVCMYKKVDAKTRQKLILKQKLAIRYFMFNGLSPMELSQARIENLDPVTCELFLPRRHWKNNCVADIDAETVRLQILYSGDRKKGPLLVSRKTGGHYARTGLTDLVKRIAERTNIVGKELVSPLILKRTYAKFYLRTPGNTIGGLQKSFSHKHLWSTAHYLRFVMEDVQEEKQRMMERLEGTKQHPMDRLENQVRRFNIPDTRMERRVRWLQRGSREKRKNQVPEYSYDPY